ncbi:MAG: hypothetical protein ACI37S_03635 [Candidatus Gastranaerophilaceae bacterium]
MISKITNVSFKNNTSELKNDAENTEVQPVTNMLEQDTKDVDTFETTQTQTNTTTEPKKGNLITGILGIVELLSSFMSLLDTKNNTKK